MLRLLELRADRAAARVKAVDESSLFGHRLNSAHPADIDVVKPYVVGDELPAGLFGRGVLLGQNRCGTQQAQKYKLPHAPNCKAVGPARPS